MNKAFDPHLRGFRASRTATRHAKEAYCILPGARMLSGVIGSSMIQHPLPGHGSWLLRNPRKWNPRRITAPGSTTAAFHRARGEPISGRKAQLPLPRRGDSPPCTHSSPSAAQGAWTQRSLSVIGTGPSARTVPPRFAFLLETRSTLSVPNHIPLMGRMISG